MESKTQESYILTKFNERNIDRQVSSSVEVEKMKIERSEAEGTHTWWIGRTIVKLRAIPRTEELVVMTLESVD